MWIAIEGADGSGKTTISQELAKTLKAEWVEFPYCKEDKSILFREFLPGEGGDFLPSSKDLMFLLDFLNFDRKRDPKKTYISDRSLLSCYLHSPTPASISYIDRFVNRFKLDLPDFIFVAHISLEDAQKRLTERGFDIDLREELPLKERIRRYKDPSLFLPKSSSLYDLYKKGRIIHFGSDYKIDEFIKDSVDIINTEKEERI